MKLQVTAKVFLYPGMAGWHFVFLDKKNSEKIKKKYGKSRRGFGAIRVAVTLGKTKWETSIFPDKKSDTYLLPLKAKVRYAEGIFDGDTVKFSIRII